MQHSRKGFTLIELSIVLVIIGLIVGGVLVGQSLISAAAVRAQISQIEKFNSAANTFYGKYGYLPGDMLRNVADQFGFNSGPNCDGSKFKRDGNGAITGYLGGNGPVYGEPGLFWQDLSSVGLISGAFPNGGAPYVDCTAGATLSLTVGASYLGDYLPQGKAGYGTFVYIYNQNGPNWFGLSAMSSLTGSNTATSTGGLSVADAYRIDGKIDDGLPTSGNVQAVYMNGPNSSVYWSNSAPSDSSTTCYNTNFNTYSVGYSGGTGVNCGLSFKMQAGD